MNIAADPVLELLQQHNIPMPPRQINLVLDEQEGDSPSRSSIFRAIDDLSEYGLIEQHPDGPYYRITPLGRGYLAGEVDASDLSPGEE